MRRLCLLLALVPAAARAAPLVEPHVGGPVFVGPTSPSVTAIFYNPAAAGLMKGTHLLVTLSPRFDYTSIDRDTVSSSDGEPDPAGDRTFATDRGLDITPGGFAGIVTDFRGYITVGLALYDPQADAQRDHGTDVGYRQTSGSVYTSTLAISLSYRATSRIFFGAAVHIDTTRLELGFFRDTALDSCAAPPCGVEDPTRAAHYKFTGDLTPSIQFTFGLLFKLKDWWWGASFTTPFCGAVASAYGADVEVTPAGGGEILKGRGRVSFNTPCLIQLGARRDLFSDYDLLINVRYIAFSSSQNWDLRTLGSELRAAQVPEWIPRYRGFSDVVSIEAGIENQPASPLRIGARARYETSAVLAKDVNVDQIDGAKLELSGGLEWRLSTRFALVGGYSLALLLPISTAPSGFSPGAAIDCNASGHDLSTAACAAAREGRGTPSAAGSYLKIGNQLTLGFAYDWW